MTRTHALTLALALLLGTALGASGLRPAHGQTNGDQQLAALRAKLEHIVATPDDNEMEARLYEFGLRFGVQSTLRFGDRSVISRGVFLIEPRGDRDWTLRPQLSDDSVQIDAWPSAFWIMSKTDDAPPQIGEINDVPHHADTLVVRTNDRIFVIDAEDGLVQIFEHPDND